MDDIQHYMTQVAELRKRIADLEEKLELCNRLRVQRFHYIAELELSLKLRDKRIAELELSEEKYRLHAMDLEERLEEKELSGET